MAFAASALRPDVPERAIAVLTSFLSIVTFLFVGEWACVVSQGEVL